jgi:hypothetical protein
MDCFGHDQAAKHAVHKSRLGAILINFTRAWCAPSIISVGVALKALAEDAGDAGSCLQCQDRGALILFCCGSAITSGSFVVIYHLHRTVYFDFQFAWMRFTLQMLVAGLFFIFPWLPCVNLFAVLGGCFGIWGLLSVIHDITDDFLSTDGGTSRLPQSEGPFAPDSHALLSKHKTSSFLRSSRSIVLHVQESMKIYESSADGHAQTKGGAGEPGPSATRREDSVLNGNDLESGSITIQGLVAKKLAILECHDDAPQPRPQQAEDNSAQQLAET